MTNEQAHKETVRLVAARDANARAADKYLAQRDALAAALRVIYEKDWSHNCADAAAEEMVAVARAALAALEVRS